MEKKKITEEMRIDLRADMPEGAYKKHPTKTFLTTLKAMYIVERLNDVFGLGMWGVTHEIELKTDSYILIRGQLVLTEYICDIPVQFGGHTIVGKNTEIADGYKSAITDCLSKLASYLEIGLEMFKGNIKPDGTIIAPPKTITWLSYPQFKKAIKDFSISDLEKTIKQYSTETKKMDNEFKKDLEFRILEMKNEMDLAEQTKKDAILNAK